MTEYNPTLALLRVTVDRVVHPDPGVTSTYQLVTTRVNTSNGLVEQALVTTSQGEFWFEMSEPPARLKAQVEGIDVGVLCDSVTLGEDLVFSSRGRMPFSVGRVVRISIGGSAVIICIDDSGKETVVLRPSLETVPLHLPA